MKENLPSLFCFLIKKIKKFLSATIGHHHYNYSFFSICLNYLPQNRISLRDYSSDYANRIKTIIIELDDG